MSQIDSVSPDVRDWLLEEDDPSARYLAMRDLLDNAPDDPELVAARRTAHHSGRIAKILDAMDPEGFWFKAGPGYSPKYKSTVWTLIMLSQLGASAHEDARILSACEHLFQHALTNDGAFSISGAPSYNVECLQGNVCAAMLDLGVDDPRLEAALDWMARGVTGEGVAPATDKTARPRYYYFNSGPDFACGINNDRACAWGAVKVMLAFSKLPEDRRTPLIQRAIHKGVDFLFSVDPALATYPTKNDAKPSARWRQFAFPVFYVTDILQNVETLVALGCGGDPRLANALAFIRGKQDGAGRWPLEHTYTTWVSFGKKRAPNKWVTIRALRTLKATETLLA